MKRFCDLVYVLENNEHCALLKVKPDCGLEMIKLGCFGGDEDMIRVARDDYNTITVFTKDGKHYEWTRNTLVTESMKAKRIMIMDYFNLWCNIVPKAR